MIHRIAFVLNLAACLAAQTSTGIAPSGHDVLEGNSNNVVPWWTPSATYQQVHDAADLAIVFGGPSATIRGLSYRPNDLAGPMFARSLEVQITLGATPVAARSASTTFATNLGGAPVRVLAYTTINLPLATSTSAPNPQAWFFPFATPFAYSVSAGNLCYELRLRNASVWDNNTCDAVTMNPVQGRQLGNGCTATGQPFPATITSQFLSARTGAFSSTLSYALPQSAAALVLGLTAQQSSFPGVCAQLETVPLVTFSGQTDVSGTWAFSLNVGSTVGTPPTTIYTQFLFADAGLPGGGGVSTCQPMEFGPPQNASVTRIWAAPYQSGGGNENATQGAIDYGFGLVTGFQF